MKLLPGLKLNITGIGWPTLHLEFCFFSEFEQVPPAKGKDASEVEGEETEFAEAPAKTESAKTSDLDDEGVVEVGTCFCSIMNDKSRDRKLSWMVSSWESLMSHKVVRLKAAVLFNRAICHNR